MKLLIICNWGKNRSAYLASYLKEKGYLVQYGGIYPESGNLITQEIVDWADILIFVKPQTREDFDKRFRKGAQKLITLDVEDRISVLAPKKEDINDEEWTKIQQEMVYPKLKSQIDKYLPFN